MFLSFSVLVANAQNFDEASSLLERAIKLMEKAKYDDSIELLREAKKMDTNFYEIDYEIALAFYNKFRSDSSIVILESLIKKDRVQDLYYQLLGNSYDMKNKRKKAIEVYKQGLEKFPNSGRLYLELGVVHLLNNHSDEALTYFERGIEVEPEYPSNYFHAARLLLDSKEKVWGMIFGEIFIILEPFTQRTTEISQMIYDTYLSEIRVKSDTSYKLSFTKDDEAEREVNDDSTYVVYPYGFEIYQPVLAASLYPETKIDLNSLIRVRTRFIENYYKNEKVKSIPNILFDYQKKIYDAGHFEAYNYLVLHSSDMKSVEEWNKSTKHKITRLIQWMSINQLDITKDNMFYRFPKSKY